MANVVRADNGEQIGFFIDLMPGALEGFSKWPFMARRHPSGLLRNEPPGIVARGGRLTALPSVRVMLPTGRSEKGEMEIVVPPEYLDFVLNHTGFRAIKPQTAR
jgi:hypothetical protein